MKKFLIILSFLIIYNISFSQKHDYTWIVGYNGANKADYPDFGTTFLSFTHDTLNKEAKFIQMDYNETNICMSDSAGNFLFTSNMARVMGKDGKYVFNGDTLLYRKSADYNYGYRVIQGLLSLQIPNNKNKYLLLYPKRDVYYCFPLYTSIFDSSISTNGGIENKNNVLLDEKVGIGKITACKHGNGRDWWIRVPSNEAAHYVFLLDNKGIKLHSKQKIGYKLEEGLGQAVFSPDGKRFVETNTVDNKIGMDINIYDFDRCSGLLSNYKRIHFDSSNFVGCAISPNSRFLYFSNGWRVLQYDLEAADIKASEVIVANWDYFVDFGGTGFLYMQLAPDNKIYITTSSSTHYMHTIEKPDEKGLACQVKQRSVKLFNYNSWSMPNHPNYRLGALKGSPCDTLQGGVDTKEMESKTFEVEIYPNPANDYVTFSWAEPTENVIISVNDLLGRILYTAAVNDNTLRLDTASFPSGVYQVNFKTPDAKLSHIAKIVVNH